jgi:hypothetical protein
MAEFFFWAWLGRSLDPPGDAKVQGVEGSVRPTSVAEFFLGTARTEPRPPGDAKVQGVEGSVRPTSLAELFSGHGSDGASTLPDMHVTPHGSDGASTLPGMHVIPHGSGGSLTLPATHRSKKNGEIENWLCSTTPRAGSAPLRRRPSRSVPTNQ